MKVDRTVIAGAGSESWKGKGKLEVAGTYVLDGQGRPSFGSDGRVLQEDQANIGLGNSSVMHHVRVERSSGYQVASLCHCFLGMGKVNICIGNICERLFLWSELSRASLRVNNMG